MIIPFVRFQDSVLIITMFEAQKHLAKAHLPPGYDVVTIEEAQVRIVIRDW